MLEAGTKPKQNYKIFATGVFGVIAALGLIALIICEPDPNRSTTFLISLAGCIFGWVVGVITSPYDKKDESKIDKFTKLIGTFLSGYILAKLDKIIENYFSVTTIQSSLSNMVGLRVLFFICCFLLTWVVVFIYRLYASGDTPNAKETLKIEVVKESGQTNEVE